MKRAMVSLFNALPKVIFVVNIGVFFYAVQNIVDYYRCTREFWSILAFFVFLVFINVVGLFHARLKGPAEIAPPREPQRSLSD
jgi:hypothetical protein